MKRKICELTGAALNYAVALAEGVTSEWRADGPFLWHGKPCERVAGHDIEYRPSSGPAGDDIIDREGISVIRCDDDYGTDAQGFTTSKRIPVWAATMGQHSADETYGSQGDSWGRAFTLDAGNVVYGATRREAAMRCWAIYELGECRWADLALDLEIDIPEELCS